MRRAAYLLYSTWQATPDHAETEAFQEPVTARHIPSGSGQGTDCVASSTVYACKALRM